MKRSFVPQYPLAQLQNVDFREGMIRKLTSTKMQETRTGMRAFCRLYEFTQTLPKDIMALAIWGAWLQSARDAGLVDSQMAMLVSNCERWYRGEVAFGDENLEAMDRGEGSAAIQSKVSGKYLYAIAYELWNGDGGAEGYFASLADPRWEPQPIHYMHANSADEAWFFFSQVQTKPISIKAIGLSIGAFTTGKTKTVAGTGIRADEDRPILSV
jgi:hypothetical protein